MIDISKLSKSYSVRGLEESDYNGQSGQMYDELPVPKKKK